MLINYSEEWKPIVGYPGYEVSNLGNVRRVSVLQLKQQINPRGRKTVCLYGPNGKKYARVHCLVAAAFIGARAPGMEINHKDGDRLNNTAANLEYLTADENREHARKLGLYIGRPTTLLRAAPIF